MVVSMLSTKDNPWDYFTQFPQWYTYDVLHGYKSCEILARHCKTSSELSDAEYEQLKEEAIDEILESLKHDLSCLRIKVKKDVNELSYTPL